MELIEDHAGVSLSKKLSHLVILSMEKTMAAKVISELMFVSGLFPQIGHLSSFLI